MKSAPEHARRALEQEGVIAGARLKVERRVGMGGPIIVRLGRARLAISRATAAGVEVELVTVEPAAAEPPETGSGGARP